jgi:thermitase
MKSASYKILLTVFLLCHVTILVKAQQKIENQFNDSLFLSQKKFFEKINAFEAWKFTKGNPNVIVGIIENGFDFFHPDLEGQLIFGYYAPDVSHIENYNNTAHGTLVASIMAAKGNNEIGMVGLAPDCKFLTASTGTIGSPMLNFMNDFRKSHRGISNNENVDSLLTSMLQNPSEELKMEFKKKTAAWLNYIVRTTSQSIVYLVNHGAKVINLSMLLQTNSIKQSQYLDIGVKNEFEEAFRYAAEKDVILVMGAGNDSKENVDYPGDSTKTVIVGASLLDDSRWDQEVSYMGRKIKQGSDYGKRLSVMAPSENMVVCNPHDKHFYMCDNGPEGPNTEEYQSMYETLKYGATSCATPVVTSLIALIYSIRPDLDAATVIKILKQGCDDVGEKGYDIYTGYGRVNFGKTLEIAKNY